MHHYRAILLIIHHRSTVLIKPCCAQRVACCINPVVPPHPSAMSLAAVSARSTRGGLGELITQSTVIASEDADIVPDEVLPAITVASG